MPTTATSHPVALANRLRPVLLKLNRHLRREIHSLGVTGGQVSLLNTLQQNPSIGMTELAHHEGFSAPALSKYVDRLEAAGLVRREPSATDRRRVGLKLTAEGDRVLRSVKQRRTAWLADRMKHLDARELKALEQAVVPLARLVEDEE
ncbi:MAG: MarR family transcriptional regulator [Actinomycetota bacterium]|nr:MarR family transcriptional regulator [Actinomycetota bacterium]